MAVENPEDGLKKLEYLSLVSKVCTELAPHHHPRHSPSEADGFEEGERQCQRQDHQVQGSGHRGRQGPGQGASEGVRIRGQRKAEARN